MSRPGWSRRYGSSWRGCGMSKFGVDIDMIQFDLLSQIAIGEDSPRRFKEDVKNVESLASEMAAFADTGGMVLSGLHDLINDLLDMRPAR